MVTEIYTDGACLGNPGPGGWAWDFMRGDVKVCFGSGGDYHTTNNRMELMAVIDALERLPLEDGVVRKLYTDSKYVLEGFTKWLAGWQAKGWKLANGKPVKNADLWERLHIAHAPHDIEWVWVKGHSGIEGNELVDKRASKSARSFADVLAQGL